MAKKATKAGGAAKRKSSGSAKSGTKSRAVARVSSSGSGRSGGEGFDAAEAFTKLLQSPLVADLLAVGATAALAALAEHGFSSRGADGSGGKRAGKAVKEAGKAAAAAIGRRLNNELDEIRKAAKDSSARSGAAA
jgi:hypothetical protein